MRGRGASMDSVDGVDLVDLVDRVDTVDPPLKVLQRVYFVH
jgi:hypothetical protein